MRVRKTSMSLGWLAGHEPDAMQPISPAETEAAVGQVEHCLSIGQIHATTIRVVRKARPDKIGVHDLGACICREFHLSWRDKRHPCDICHT